jgi:hypothetical protein
MACNLVPGWCGAIPLYEVDEGCFGNSVCDGEGACKLADGQACTDSQECASGKCLLGACD